MVMRQVGLMTLVGGAIGLGAAVGLGQLAQSLLFQLKGSDPVVLLGGAVALTLVALAAGLHPRAPRVAGGSDERAALRVGETIEREDRRVRRVRLLGAALCGLG